MATTSFPWEYHAMNSLNQEPKNFMKYVILIGLNDKTPITVDDDTFIIRIDKNLNEIISDKEVRICTEWGEVLRLPVDGPYNEDHPLLIASRRHQTTWIGNIKFFPTIYDLIIAASHHNKDSQYFLAEKNADGQYIVIPRSEQYHPISGKLPIIPLTLSEKKHVVNERLLSIILGVIWFYITCLKCGHFDRDIKIYKNLYSAFSANTSAVVLIISYFGLGLTGDGSVQDKLDRNAEYRRELAIRAMDVTMSYMAETKTNTPYDCAKALVSYFGITVSSQAAKLGVREL